jgi:hypothetical protein
MHQQVAPNEPAELPYHHCDACDTGWRGETGSTCWMCGTPGKKRLMPVVQQSNSHPVLFEPEPRT